MAYVYKPYVKKEYQQSQGVQDAQAALQQHQQTKPGSYESKYQQQIDALYGKITDRPKFHYDINEDALYQSMAQRYQQQGKQAMMDTMGQAAALTGGYGSSYGQSVGQQTYQGYLQALADLVPDYYQMALNAYNAEGDQLYKQYAMAMEQEGQDYSRWQDRNNAYLQELSRLQGVYESERSFDYGKWQQDQSFDYGMWKDDQDSQYQQDRDALSDQRYDQEWKYQQERDRVADEHWLKQFQESQRQYNESMAWQREQAAAAAAAAAAKRSGGGGGGSSRKSGSSSDGKIDAAAEYARLRANGASGIESDRYLKAAVAAGLLDERYATQLRDSRVSQNRKGLVVQKLIG